MNEKTTELLTKIVEIIENDGGETTVIENGFIYSEPKILIALLIENAESLVDMSEGWACPYFDYVDINIKEQPDGSYLYSLFSR